MVLVSEVVYLRLLLREGSKGPCLGEILHHKKLGSVVYIIFFHFILFATIFSITYLLDKFIFFLNSTNVILNFCLSCFISPTCTYSFFLIGVLAFESLYTFKFVNFNLKHSFFFFFFFLYKIKFYSSII